MARRKQERSLVAPGEGRDPDFLTAEELASRLDLDVQTVRDLAASGVLSGQYIGRWLFSWTAIYTWIAGPGIPSGEILSARQLAGLGVPLRAVLEAAGTPGTPGKLPGRKIGKKWCFAAEAARAWLSQPAPADAGPRRSRSQPVVSQPAGPTPD